MKPEEELIQLRAENQALRDQPVQRDELLAQVLQRVQALEERVAKDSHNSSRPPSSDRFSRQKKTRSLRKHSGKKAGGQPGHAGTTLELSETPDEVLTLLPVTQCQHSQGYASATFPSGAAWRACTMDHVWEPWQSIC